MDTGHIIYYIIVLIKRNAGINGNGTIIKDFTC